MKTCMVLGGTRGIGAAMAKMLHRDGLRVAVASKNPAHVTEFVQTANEDGGDVLGLPCDVTNESQVISVMNEVADQLGPIEVLINAAGIHDDRLLARTTVSDIHELLNVNLVGTMLTCKAVIRSMMQQKSGCIINIGSIVGSKGNAGQCAYSASKAGIEGFTKSLAKEVATRGIRVNCINPGYIRTDMTAALEGNASLLKQIPLQRMGEAEEVAQVARFLLDATYITGQTIFVDGGLQINH